MSCALQSTVVILVSVAKTITSMMIVRSAYTALFKRSTGSIEVVVLGSVVGFVSMTSVVIGEER